jgi:hypothetical protein
MKRHILFCALILSSLWLLPLTSNGVVIQLGGEDFDFEGAFQKDNDIELFEFTVNSSRKVTIFTSSWLYGDPLAGAGSGGFDPVVSLWDSDDTYIASSSFSATGSGSLSSNGVSYNYGVRDAVFTRFLSPGIYTVTLTQFDNLANNRTANVGKLTDGFRRDNEADFTKQFGSQPLFNGTWDSDDPRTRSWELHILNVDSATMPVSTPAQKKRLDDVLLDFGNGRGFWARINNAIWSPLHSASPSIFSSGDLDAGGQMDVVTAFPNSGLWAYMNSSSWKRLHPSSKVPAKLAIGDVDGNGQADIVADYSGTFGGIWVRRNLGSWKKLHRGEPEAIQAGDLDGNGKADILVDFGSAGLWTWMNDSRWQKLHGKSPDHFALGDVDGDGKDDLIIDFQSTVEGIWVKPLQGKLKKLHASPSKKIICGDLDGNGKADIIIDFGGHLGLWARINEASWKKLNKNSPAVMTIADIDLSGKSELVASFTNIGTWMYVNNRQWVRLHTLMPDRLGASDIDGSTGGGSPTRPGVNRAPTLACLSRSDVQLSNGRSQTVRKAPLSAVIPGVPTLLNGAELPRVFSLQGADPTQTNAPVNRYCSPNQANPVYRAARLNLPSSASLVVAERAADEDGDPTIYQWEQPKKGSLYSTGLEGSSFASGALITDVSQYNRNSVIYEAPDYYYPIQDSLLWGGLEKTAVRVTDGNNSYSPYRAAGFQYDRGIELLLEDPQYLAFGNNLVLSLNANITEATGTLFWPTDRFEAWGRTWCRIYCNDPRLGVGVHGVFDLAPDNTVIPSVEMQIRPHGAARTGTRLMCRYPFDYRKGSIFGRTTKISVMCSSPGPGLTFNPFVTRNPPPDYQSVSAVQTDGAVVADTIVVKFPDSPPVNHAPKAKSQTVTTAQDTEVKITLTGSDPDGDPLTFTVTSQPSSGTLSGSGANLVYTPNSGYTGQDSFRFKVNDGVVDSAEATVVINVSLKPKEYVVYTIDNWTCFEARIVTVGERSRLQKEELVCNYYYYADNTCTTIASKTEMQGGFDTREDGYKYLDRLKGEWMINRWCPGNGYHKLNGKSGWYMIF